MPYPFLDDGFYTPFNDGRAVTPADGSDLPSPGVCRALSVNVSGNVSLDTAGGTTLTVAVVAGQPLYLKIKRVRATSTTATGITAWY